MAFTWDAKFPFCQSMYTFIMNPKIIYFHVLLDTDLRRKTKKKCPPRQKKKKKKKSVPNNKKNSTCMKGTRWRSAVCDTQLDGIVKLAIREHLKTILDAWNRLAYIRSLSIYRHNALVFETLKVSLTDVRTDNLDTNR